MSMERRRYFSRGLDVGTSFVRCAEMQGQEVVARAERSAFIDIDQSDFTAGMLGMAKLDFVKSGNKIQIVGDEALDFASISDTTARRPLSAGIISPSEEEAIPIIERIIRGVAGEARQGGELLYFSVPGEPLDAEVNLAYHEKTITGILRKLGYHPKPINEGLAVIFSELSDEQFTGIGMSFGGGMVNVCFAFRSIPLLTFALARGGDWIDRKAAIAVGDNASRVCAIKESKLDLSEREGDSAVLNALSIAYDEFIGYVAENMNREVSRMMSIPQHATGAIPIVLSGGTASPKGFAEHFKKALRSLDFPLDLANVKTAKNPFESVANGALTASQVEVSAPEQEAS